MVFQDTLQRLEGIEDFTAMCDRLTPQMPTATHGYLARGAGLRCDHHGREDGYVLSWVAHYLDPWLQAPDAARGRANHRRSTTAIPGRHLRERTGFPQGVSPVHEQMVRLTRRDRTRRSRLLEESVFLPNGKASGKTCVVIGVVTVVGRNAPEWLAHGGSHSGMVVRPLGWVRSAPDAQGDRSWIPMDAVPADVSLLGKARVVGASPGTWEWTPHQRHRYGFETDKPLQEACGGVFLCEPPPSCPLTQMIRQRITADSPACRVPMHSDGYGANGLDPEDPSGRTRRYSGRITDRAGRLSR